LRRGGGQRPPSAGDPALKLPDLDAMARLAAAVAARVRAGDAILLSGPLGAGKTEFARAFLRALSGDPALEVPSPSFTLLQSYDTPRGTVHHFDLWRIEAEADLAELGWEDALRDIVVVEWPERLGARRPGGALEIALAFGEGDAREARLSGWVGRIADLVP